jgi:hypothetical protein
VPDTFSLHGIFFFCCATPPEQGPCPSESTSSISTSPTTASDIDPQLHSKTKTKPTTNLPYPRAECDSSSPLYPQTLSCSEYSKRQYKPILKMGASRIRREDRSRTCAASHIHWVTRQFRTPPDFMDDYILHSLSTVSARSSAGCYCRS